MSAIDDMPLTHMQWIPRDQLHANNYNPNHVAPPEMHLLKQSIMEDGWTQPIVARHDGEIVDGFHRWTCSGDPKIANLTGGLVPVVFLRPSANMDDQMISTIRHNRARGSHSVLRMADIMIELLDNLGVNTSDEKWEELKVRLGMDDEEIQRLKDRGDMLKRAARTEFNKGWTPSS